MFQSWKKEISQEGTFFSVPSQQKCGIFLVIFSCNFLEGLRHQPPPWIPLFLSTLLWTESFFDWDNAGKKCLVKLTQLRWMKMHFRVNLVESLVSILLTCCCCGWSVDDFWKFDLNQTEAWCKHAYWVEIDFVFIFFQYFLSRNTIGEWSNVKLNLCWTPPPIWLLGGVENWSCIKFGKKIGWANRPNISSPFKDSAQFFHSSRHNFFLMERSLVAQHLGKSQTHISENLAVFWMYSGFFWIQYD